MDNCIFAGSLADKYTEKLQTGEIEHTYDAIYRACLDMAEAKDNELAGEAKMTLAAKYADKASKSLRTRLLEAVEAKLSALKEGQEFSFTIGWCESGYENSLDIREPTILCPMDALTSEGSHEEINAIMKAEGFKPIEDYGGYRHRARTTYMLER